MLTVSTTELLTLPSDGVHAAMSATCPGPDMVA